MHHGAAGFHHGRRTVEVSAFDRCVIRAHDVVGSAGSHIPNHTVSSETRVLRWRIQGTFRRQVQQLEAGLFDIKVVGIPCVEGVNRLDAWAFW